MNSLEGTQETQEQTQSSRRLQGASKFDPECPICKGSGTYRAEFSREIIECHCWMDYQDQFLPSDPVAECKKCQGFGVVISAKAGVSSAEICSCSEGGNRALRTKLTEISELISSSNIPPLFANSSYKGHTFDEVAHPSLISWLERVCQSSSPSPSNLLFLCGSVGNGKTHMAVDALKRFVCRTGRSARFMNAEDVIEAKRSSDRFAHRKERREKDFLDYVQRVVRFADLLVIDEIGRTRVPASARSTFELFMDLRYQSGLPTILISNHTFKKETSLDGVKIDEVVGQRAADRLREFIAIELSGPSKRRLRDRSELAEVTVSEEERRNFKLPPSILMQEEGELQILNWITRNPVFEAIRDRDRELEVDGDGKVVHINGIPKDASRKQAKVVRDIWQKGDQLVVNGPYLSHEDAKTYVTCLEVLRQHHKSNRPGLTISLSSVEILKALGKSDSGDARTAMHRSLRRLSEATIVYNDNIGRVWQGPLITTYYSPVGYSDFYEISFNQSMIRFYSDFEYTRFNQRLFEAQIGTDGLRMQLFLRSHKDPTFDRLSFDGWMKFLEKPVEEMDDSPRGKKIRRQHRKKFSELIKKQVNAGLLTNDSGLVRGSPRISLTVTQLQ